MKRELDYIQMIIHIAGDLFAICKKVNHMYVDSYYDKSIKYDVTSISAK